MAYTTINKHTAHFNTNLHTGTGSSQNITTGLDMSNNGGMVWNKLRSGSNNHVMWDTIRTATKTIYPDLTAVEATEATSLTAFTTTGWTGGGGGNTNANGSTYVSWNWLAGSSHSGASNSDGSITSTVSANTTAGFSIVKYTGNGGSTAKTVGHGLGVAPKVVIIKPTNLAYDWMIYNENVGATKGMCLNTNQAQFTSSNFNDTAPTTSVFSVKNNATNETNGTYIAYCFAEKTGYSKFNSISGNGNNDGTFCFTGFAPSFVLYKKMNAAGDWYFVDNKRPGYNDNDKRLYANTNQAEETYDLINLYSNGFKLTNTTHAYTNDSAGTYLYMAFGQSLVGSNNVPCTAR